MRAIKVVDYDTSWPLLFAAISAEVSVLLGDLVQSIDHIGSTSVPGLAAKPKIDLDVVVVSDDALPAAIELVRAADFTFHGDPHGDGRWVFTRNREACGYRLYVCPPDNPVHRQRILFRNYPPRPSRKGQGLCRPQTPPGRGGGRRLGFLYRRQDRVRRGNDKIGYVENMKPECAAHSGHRRSIALAASGYDLAFADVVCRADETFLFHPLHQGGGSVVADAEAALDVGG